MVATTVFRISMSPTTELFFNLLIVGGILYYLLSSLISTLYGRAQRKKLQNLRKFTVLSSETVGWLKEHYEDLERDPIGTLNNSEFIDMIHRDQKLYNQIIKDYPDYPDTCMPPEGLHQYLIELAKEQYKQTH